MTGEIEAAGELATGALLGRAVEGHAAADGPHPAMCLNCGTALLGPHCHRCGQSGHVHRSLGAIGHEILHGVAHFEGKLWRTLPLLAWRPGELTRRYIEGERVRFVSPMAIFLFSVFAMFAVFSWAGISAPADLSPASQLEGGFKDARKKLEKEHKELAEARAKVPDGNPGAEAIDARIAENEAELRALARSEAELRKNGLSGTTVHVAKTGWAALDHGLEKWKKNPSLMLYKLQSSAYKFSWLLIPLSLPFVWLLFFWKRRFKLYDHTVFITYSIAFMSLLFIAVTIGAAIGIGTGWLMFASFVIPFVHITRQLKQAYAIGWIPATLRAAVLSFFITVILTIFIALLVLLGALG